MPRFTKRSQDPPVLVQFDNAIISTICHPNVLIGCDHQTTRVADAGPLVDEAAILVEDLYALILTVADIDATLLVDGNRVGQIEFSWAGAELAPGLNVIAVPIELDDARIAVTVGYPARVKVEIPVCFDKGKANDSGLRRVTGNAEVSHLDEKRPTRTVADLHQVAATGRNADNTSK